MPMVLASPLHHKKKDDPMYDAIKEAIVDLQIEIDTGDSLSEIKTACQLYRKVKDLKNEMDDLLKAANKIHTKMTEDLMPALFDQEDIKNITVEGFQYIVTHKSRATMKDKEAAFEFFREKGQESIITETINWQTLDATIKLYLEEGLDVPDEIFDVYIQAGMSVRAR